MSDWLKTHKEHWALVMREQGRVLIGLTQGYTELSHADCPACARLGREAERHGLESGGWSWSSVDEPHAAVWSPDEFPGTPDA